MKRRARLKQGGMDEERGKAEKGRQGGQKGAMLKKCGKAEKMVHG